MNPNFDKGEYYVVSVFKCGFIPLGTFSKEEAERIKVQEEKRQKCNPLFKHVYMGK